MGNIRALLLGYLILIAAACGKNVDNIGKPIQFGLSSLSTRTAYTSDYDGRIKWEDGDQVTIWMGWEGGDHLECEDYRVYRIRDVNQQSYGRLKPVGNSLEWHGEFRDGRAYEYEHTFYSVYPASAGYSFDNSSVFSLYLPEDQTGMDVGKAPLVAYSTSKDRVDSDGGVVYLEYYPMFTTLCVTVDNKAGLPTGNGLRLSSDQYSLVGSYSVDARYPYESVSGGAEKSVSCPLRDNKATFFIIPREYGKDKLYFSLGDKTMSIPETLYPGFKYNIKITTKEVEVEPGFSSFVNGVILAEAHKQGSPFYHPGWQFGYVDGEQKIFWNNPNNNNNWEPVPDEFLWEIINGLVDLDVEGTWEIGYVITPDDLNIFPNLRTVNLKGWFQNVEINNPNITELNIESTQLNNLHIHGCNSLTTFHVENNNNFKSIVVEDCEILEYFTLTGPSGEGVKMRCENCPVLEWFSLTGGVNGDGSPWNFPFHKDIINCPLFSHYDVPGCIEN